MEGEQSPDSLRFTPWPTSHKRCFPDSASCWPPQHSDIGDREIINTPRLITTTGEDLVSRPLTLSGGFFQCE